MYQYHSSWRLAVFFLFITAEVHSITVQMDPTTFNLVTQDRVLLLLQNSCCRFCKLSEVFTVSHVLIIPDQKRWESRVDSSLTWKVKPSLLHIIKLDQLRQARLLLLKSNQIKSNQEDCPTSTSSSSTWLANPTKYHYVGRWVMVTIVATGDADVGFHGWMSWWWHQAFILTRGYTTLIYDGGGGVWGASYLL